VRLAQFTVDVAEKPFSVAGQSYPAGSWIIAAQTGVRPALDPVAADLALDIDATAALPDVPRHPIDLPRIGVLQTWTDTQSAGWVRMIFDDEKVPYTAIMDDDVKAGRLNERFDVILMPNTESSLKSIITGIDPKFSPLAYTKAPEFPTQGMPTSSPDITGGLSWKGVANLEEFVRSGGVLITRAHHARGRLDAAARRRHRARRAPRAVHRRRRSREFPESPVPAAGPSHRVRLPGDDRGAA
jgi:hypothetical protein